MPHHDKPQDPEERLAFNRQDDERAEDAGEGTEAEGHIMAWGKQEDRDPSDLHFNKPDDEGPETEGHAFFGKPEDDEEGTDAAH